MTLPANVDVTQPFTRIQVVQPCMISRAGHTPVGSYVWPGDALKTLFYGPVDAQLISRGIVRLQFIDTSEPEVVQLPVAPYIEPVTATPMQAGTDTVLTADITLPEEPSHLVELTDHEPIVILDDVVPAVQPASIVTHEDTLSGDNEGSGV